MHYGNGREAKNGDLVVMIEGLNSLPKAGVLALAVAGQDYCNGRIMSQSSEFVTANLKNCFHVEDVLKAFVPPAVPVEAKTENVAVEAPAAPEAQV